MHRLDNVQLLIIHRPSVLAKDSYQEESIIEAAAQRRLRSHSACDQEGRNSARTSAKKNPFNKVKPWNRLDDTVSDAEKAKEKRRASTFPGETHNTSVHGMQWNVASGERRRRRHGICPKERWTHAKDSNYLSSGKSVTLGVLITSQAEQSPVTARIEKKAGWWSLPFSTLTDIL